MIDRELSRIAFDRSSSGARIAFFWRAEAGQEPARRSESDLALQHRAVNELADLGVDFRQLIHGDIGDREHGAHQDHRKHEHLVGELEVFHGGDPGFGGSQWGNGQ